MLLHLRPLLLGAYLAVHGMVATAGCAAPTCAVAQRLVRDPAWITTVGGLMLLYRLLPSATVRWRGRWLARCSRR